MSLNRRRFLKFLGLAPAAIALPAASACRSQNATAAAEFHDQGKTPQPVPGIERRPCPFCGGTLSRFMTVDASAGIHPEPIGILRCVECRRVWTPHELEFLESHRDPYAIEYTPGSATMGPEPITIVGRMEPTQRKLDEWYRGQLFLHSKITPFTKGKARPR